MNTRLKHFVTIIALPIGIGSPAPLLGQDAEGTVKYRQNYMAALGGHAGALRQLITGGYADESHVALHAEALAEMSVDLEKMFPEGSLTGKTEAKTEIWEQWDDFQAHANDSGQAAQALADAVPSGDKGVIGERFKALGEACKGCHKKFRKKTN